VIKSENVNKNNIIHAVQKALGRSELSAKKKQELIERFTRGKPNLIPKRSERSHHLQVELFMEMAEAVHASVDLVDNSSKVPSVVSDFLTNNNLTSNIVMAPDKNLDHYPWKDKPLLNIRRDKADDRDEVSVTSAAMGFAETGTLMLLSSRDRPSTLNFLPETHIVILRSEDITGSYEEGWELLRGQEDGRFEMPRTVNFITGPSRTGDIEQTMQLGAHGPRRLHIVIVES
jgi:L-lactate dehydrogenase complex protein LldG